MYCSTCRGSGVVEHGTGAPDDPYEWGDCPTCRLGIEPPEEPEITPWELARQEEELEKYDVETSSSEGPGRREKLTA